MRRRGLLTLGIVAPAMLSIGGGTLALGVVNRLAQGLVLRLGGRQVALA